MAQPKYELATLDTETDPFKRGRVPKPFAAGFYCGDHYEYFWGDDCILQFITWIEEFCHSTGRRFVIFAHNGGKFDFHFILEYIDNPIKIINARIVRAGFVAGCIVQDSFAIIPAPLKSTGEKIKIDYAKLERHSREKHKKEILTYLQQDCTVLYDWVARFIEEYGRQLTVGGTAMKQLQKFHDFGRMPPSIDAFYRDYYYGGRVECIKPGIHVGKYFVYDVNSMYSKCMKDYWHPVNAEFYRTDKLPTDPRKVYFAEIDADSDGALPLRTETGGITFPHGRNIFKACSHEINAARKFGLLHIHAVRECHVAKGTQTFAEFVDHFHEKRLAYKAAGDDFGATFAKYMLNSSYGKFGQDPDNFKDWLISWEIGSLDPEAEGYERYSSCDHFDLWCRPAFNNGDAYYDVSVAASITSAARSVLMEGLQKAVDPVYCDTDSIICKSLELEHDSTKLGAWKEEETADKVCVAGKKLYSLQRDGIWIKARSKGGKISGADIERICKGDHYLFEADAPTFSMRFNPKFQARNFKKTA